MITEIWAPLNHKQVKTARFFLPAGNQTMMCPSAPSATPTSASYTADITAASVDESYAHAVRHTASLSPDSTLCSRPSSSACFCSMKNPPPT